MKSATMLFAVVLVTANPVVALAEQQYDFSDIRNEGRLIIEKSWDELLLERLAENWHPKVFNGKLQVAVKIDSQGSVKQIVAVLKKTDNEELNAAAIKALQKTIFPLPYVVRHQLQNPDIPLAKRNEFAATVLVTLTADSARKCRDLRNRAE